jgi:DNA modification methylase
MDYKLYKGDNLENLKKLEDNSVDSVVTDPPYGLSFMNKKWDYDVPSVEFWREVYRVLKPGGHVLSFGGTRTYHRMVVNIEDAGFEIRDQIMWLYGSGFPKSHNIGKAVDKLEGNEREVVGERSGAMNNSDTSEAASFVKNGVGFKTHFTETKGSSQYEGWGTSLKPANEPICLARKPLSEKSVALNVLKWGTGGINVDGCRVGTEIIETNMKNTKGGLYNLGNEDRTNEVENTFNEGRFPANLILECICDEVIKGDKGEVKKTNRSKSFGDTCYGELKDKSVDGIDNYNDKGDIHTNPNCPCRLLDEQSGVSKSSCKSGVVEGKEAGQMYHRHEQPSNNYKKKIMVGDYSDKGGASRFFYQAKVSKKERNMGLDDTFKEGKVGHGNLASMDERFDTKSKNTHPTIKPIALMTYLCRLITPPNGVILDPFMGSGSTGIAARLEGFNFIGMEMEEDYIKIASARIENFEKYREFHNPNKGLVNGNTRMCSPGDSGIYAWNKK